MPSGSHNQTGPHRTGISELLQLPQPLSMWDGLTELGQVLLFRCSMVGLTMELWLTSPEDLQRLHNVLSRLKNGLLKFDLHPSCERNEYAAFDCLGLPNVQDTVFSTVFNNSMGGNVLTSSQLVYHHDLQESMGITDHHLTWPWKMVQMIGSTRLRANRMMYHSQAVSPNTRVSACLFFGDFCSQ